MEFGWSYGKVRGYSRGYYLVTSDDALGFYTRVMVMHQRGSLSTKWTGGGVMTKGY